ncbi:MAG TPA: 50S ribosomal protein L11 methyltransferase [Patescibacteria group bacterium]|jgi:predicted RNA methylase|nr:50S ribosomal protein L11 methyltransferase [Patescibacteria group bacterium]
MVWPPDSPWAPWWRTSHKTAQAICKLAKIKKEDLIYDLGSGDGTALITAAKEFEAFGVGIEIDPVRYWISKILIKRNGLSKRIKVVRKNFFQENIKNADVVFVYLVPKALEKLLPKFKQELKKGTRIVSFVYEINLPLKEYDKKNRIRLYII